MIKKFTQLVATIAVTASVSMAGVMATSNSANAQEFNSDSCINELSSIGTNYASVFFAILDANTVGFCDDNKETRGDYNDRIIKEMWGHCVLNRATSSERGRLQNGVNNPESGEKMYPYGGRGGSLKNRRLSAKYADNLLLRVTNGYSKYFVRSSDAILTRASRRIDLDAMARECRVPR